MYGAIEERFLAPLGMTATSLGMPDCALDYDYRAPNGWDLGMTTTALGTARDSGMTGSALVGYTAGRIRSRTGAI
jgi:CubicO group peptidase (beta-lactamase class C family)